MRIAFLMDPLDEIDPFRDTTSHFIYECAQRKHEIYFLEPHDLYIKNNTIRARMRQLQAPPNLPREETWRIFIDDIHHEKRIFEDITELDALFVRKNPPVDFRTIDFLQFVADEVFIINDVRGQIRASSKLYMLNFPNIIPETHVSRDPARLRKVIEEFGGDVIMKPTLGFRGTGVIKLSNRDPENLNSLLSFYVDSIKPYEDRNPVIIQEYIEEVRNGDVRILLLNGEILGAMRRIPCDGEFRTNLFTGARAEPHEITASDLHICHTIRTRLLEDGLYFVAVDIIGDKLIEINCASPGGVPHLNRLYGLHSEKAVVDLVEEFSLREEQKSTQRGRKP
jgi:glutathione synthase